MAACQMVSPEQILSYLRNRKFKIYYSTHYIYSKMAACHMVSPERILSYFRIREFKSIIYLITFIRKLVFTPGLSFGFNSCMNSF